eukprot:411263_1
MDALEEFLANSAKSEAIESDDESVKEETFADKLDDNRYYKSRKFEKILANRYYDNAIDSMSNDNNNQSLLHRIQSYKYKKKTKTDGKSAPRETKIHNTPLSYKSKYRLNYNDNTFVSRDPRFDTNVNSEPSGYKLRNAYQFLDDMIVRDINIIEKQIKKNQKNIKNTKKNSSEYDKNIEYHIKKKGVEIDTLKKELIKLKNRKNSINEKDLEQRAKSQVRKMEMEKVRKGVKMPYHHKLKRTRFGQVKWVKSDGNDNKQKINIQNVYFKNKYDQLTKEGKLEKYMKKKTKRINSKFRAALKKRSGRGWNDS